jgi:hypothetical protein
VGTEPDIGATVINDGSIRRSPMNDVLRTLDLAKRGKFTRAELFHRMHALAQDQHRGPGVSEAQAFCKFVQSDEGREMLQIQMSMDGRDIEPSRPTTSVAKVVDDWDVMVAATRKVTGCSMGKAIDAALATEAGRYAFAKRKRADMVSTGQYSQADLQCLDGIAVEHDRELQKREHVSQTEYQTEFDKLKAKYPGMTDSDIHTHLIAHSPALWEAHKEQLGKLGHKGQKLPQAHHQIEQAGDEDPKPARSGRKKPSQAPDWESDHSGSEPTTPERRVPEEDEEPTVKNIWQDLRFVHRKNPNAP